MIRSGKIIFIFITLFTLCTYRTTSAAEPEGILIDNPNRQLVAPEGSSYRWYLNGKLIVGKERKIKVKRSGNYRVEITDENGDKTSETIDIIVKSDGIRKIYIIGDSTVQTYKESYYPMTGWGQVLQLFFDESKIKIENKAIGGRSSRSFWEEGRWDDVVTLLDSSDYVFIQFGHNDRDWSKPERYTDTAAYKEYLRIYVNETREKGATPVLVSPMIMNAWEGSTLRNVFTEGENNYRGAMLEVAEELNALFVDLNMKSYDLVKELGAEYAAMFLHMGLEPGEYPNYPDGSTDVGTHYQEMGALNMARLIIEGITELAEDSTMAYLIDAFTPTTSVATSLSIPEAGLITKPGTYPVGSHITLKTRLPYNFSFDHWEDTLTNRVSNSNLFMFNMEEDSNYYYKAIVKDCNGEINGEANIDNCLLCSGGSTAYPPCEVIFESEEACSFTGSKSLSYVGPVRRTIVNTITAEDSASIEYSIEAAAAGTYDFVLIYLSKISGEQLNISVNGEEKISPIDLVQAEEWSDLRFQLELNEGNNTILINSLATEVGIQFDFLAAYSTNLSEGQCSTVSAASIDDSGILVYPNPFSENVTVQAEGQFEYYIYSVTGATVLNGTVEHRCDIGSELQRGMYILKIINNAGLHTQAIYKH